MELKDSILEIKVNIVVKDLVSTQKSWATVSDLRSAKALVEDVVSTHHGNMEQLERFDKERWNDLLRDRVLEKEWGRDRTLNEIQEYFELVEDEREWMETRIEVFRKMRLEGFSEERAEALVKQGKDPAQLTL